MLEEKVRLEKSRIRKEIRERLSKLGEFERRNKSRILKEKLFRKSEFRDSRVVMFYLSMKDEVETRPMIEEALNMGKRICLPIVESGKEDMIVSEIRGLSKDIVRSDSGIDEPKETCPRITDTGQIDCVVVPGLAFDDKLNRLGRGKGYYDRFLKKIPASTPKIALAFQCQKVSELPATRDDIPVTVLITA